MPPAEPNRDETQPAVSNAVSDLHHWPSAFRRLAMVLILGLVVVGTAVTAVEMLVVRRIPPLTLLGLEAAETLWSEQGPNSYMMDLSIEGTRPGTVHIEIRDGSVVAMTRDGQTPSQQRTWDVWSVPGQFEMLERELEMAEDPEREMQVASGTEILLRCKFDPRYGYPSQFHRAISYGGPEVYWKVTRFEPL